MQLKKLILHYKSYLPIFLLGAFAFFINYHYGFIGIMPGDNTVLYNGGYKVLNGYIPFSDYWLVTGPLLDYINAFFFSILGLSWKTFIIHSSLFNLLLALFSYYLFSSLNLSKKFSIFYSALISILFYPIVGTPFVDHHSTFFMILAFYTFILGVYKKKYSYYSIIPFYFCLSFLSKQTPAFYGLISILFLIFLLMLMDKKNIIKILSPLVIGTFGSLIFLIIFFYSTGINISNFIDQYIFYSKTIGDYRFSTFSFKIVDALINYKFINFFIVILTIILTKLFLKRQKDTRAIFIVLTSLFLSCVLIFHQYYTFNQNYIFFLIPYLCGIFHIFYKEMFNKKYILILSILVCVFAVTKYHFRFNEHRKFNELEKVDISKAIDAKEISPDLKGLKWISYYYPDDPEKEINNLKEVLKILSKDNSKKTIITDYQFIASALKIHDYSPNQWHHATVSFPIKGQKYFQEYKYFFINNLKKNNINFIFETTKSNKTITELIVDKSCLEKKRLSIMLVKLKILKRCKDFQ